MRQAAGWLALLLVALPASAQEWDCASPADLPQQGMNYCAYRDFQRADRALNAAWPLVVAAIKASDASARAHFPEQANGHDNLLKAQRAWIDFRDGHCTAEGARYAGGSIRPLIENSCKAQLTRQRTEQLLLLLEEG
ncbi:MULTISPECIES: lysozyme inhibitor LprI family protein [unclassified Roseitalea]|uniref:lysozyme inhibitor LprI family protein n=1 Tax=unclassified Roseitalea TaxID=2639107 RepID=UPI00273EDF54|nr:MULTISPECIES: lysozyme inhibitor LprI family protein [unclassified Roseitalea]